jgi:hypothetical protein
VTFDHSSFIVDEEKHLRLVFYAAVSNQNSSSPFAAMSAAL